MISDVVRVDNILWLVQGGVILLVSINLGITVDRHKHIKIANECYHQKDNSNNKDRRLSSS